MPSKLSNAVRKVPEPAAHTEQAIRVTGTANHVASATQCTHTKTVQCLAKNATNAFLKIILGLAADQLRVAAKAKTTGEVEHQPVAGAQRDITDPTEAGAPDLDHIQGVDRRPATLTA